MNIFFLWKKQSNTNKCGIIGLHESITVKSKNMWGDNHAVFFPVLFIFSTFMSTFFPGRLETFAEMTASMMRWVCSLWCYCLITEPVTGTYCLIIRAQCLMKSTKSIWFHLDYGLKWIPPSHLGSCQDKRIVMISLFQWHLEENRYPHDFYFDIYQNIEDLHGAVAQSFNRTICIANGNQATWL